MTPYANGWNNLVGCAIARPWAWYAGRKQVKMTASELKHRVEQAGHESHFFDRETMRYFGDRMSNYGVRAAQVFTLYDANGNYVGKQGVTVDAWELYRRRPVKHGLGTSSYFSATTFREVFPEKLTA